MVCPFPHLKSWSLWASGYLHGTVGRFSTLHHYTGARYRPPRTQWMIIRYLGKYRSSQAFHGCRILRNCFLNLDMPARILYISILADPRRARTPRPAASLLLLFQPQTLRPRRTGARWSYASKQCQDTNRRVVCQLNHKSGAARPRPDYTYYIGFPLSAERGIAGLRPFLEHGALTLRKQP